MTRGFALMCSRVGYSTAAAGGSVVNIDQIRKNQDNALKRKLLEKLEQKKIEESANTVIVLAQPNDDGQ